MVRKLFLLAAAVLLAAAPAWASWSLVANNVNLGCGATSATCAVTVTATTAGDIAIVTMRQANVTDVISDVSDGSSTYALCPGSECHGSDATLGRGIDMAYSLSLAAGKTSVTVTRSSTTNSGTWLCRVLQYRTTSGLASYDKGGGEGRAPSANPAGVTLAITGISDVILQEIVGNTPTAISGSYTDPATFSANDGWAGWVNANSGAAPTWTQQSSGRAVVAAIAIKEISTATSYSGLKLEGLSIQ